MTYLDKVITTVPGPNKYCISVSYDYDIKNHHPYFKL